MADDSTAAPVGAVTYTYSLEPVRPLLEEGVTAGWLVLWGGAPGPARIRKVTALVDADGVVSIEPDGEWEPTTVVDDGTGQ